MTARLITLLIVLGLCLAAARSARAAASAEDFVRRCLGPSTPAWRVTPPGPFLATIVSPEEFAAQQTAQACNAIAASAWVFVPGGAAYALCGATTMPILRRNVVTAYARRHLDELHYMSQDVLALNALKEAFNCKGVETK